MLAEIYKPFAGDTFLLRILGVEVQARVSSDMARESGIVVSIEDPVTCGIAGGIGMLLLGQPAGWGVLTLCLLVSLFRRSMPQRS